MVRRPLEEKGDHGFEKEVGQLPWLENRLTMTAVIPITNAKKLIANPMPNAKIAAFGPEKLIPVEGCGFKNVRVPSALVTSSNATPQCGHFVSFSVTALLQFEQ